MSILGDLQALDQDKWIELYILDATNISLGLYYFHAGTNELGGAVVWQGVSYTPTPITADGFEYDGSKFPRPKIKVANAQGFFSTLLQDYGDLVGCKIIRKRTKLRYLDAVNFSSGNPNANPSEHLEDETFYITQKTSENKIFIEWELGSALDLQNVYLPKRTIIASYCSWKYRGDGCGYTGGAVADINDVRTDDMTKDACSKTVNGCRIRWGAYNDLSYGGFVGTSLVE